LFSCLGVIKRVFTATIALSLAFILGINALGSYHIVAASDPGADLIVQDISLSPENPTFGDTVTITVIIKNQGIQDADSSRVACYIDDNYLTSEYVEPINADTVKITTFTWDAQVGSHTIRAVADSSEQVAEADENNNNKTFTFSTLAPDLIIQSITWTPEDPSKGDSITFSVAIKNQGISKSQSTRVHLSIDGNSRGYRDVYSINAGASVTRTYTWIAVAGQHPVKATVDEANHVDESNEANNEQTVTFSTLSPDLIVQDITWSPENPSENDEITFTASVKNQGSGRADSCYIALYIDDTLESSEQLSTLEAGASINTTFSWHASSGLHDIKAIIDSYNKVLESDETNNEKTVSLLTLAPDLIIKDFSWLPADAAVGDTVNFTMTIRNQGIGRAEDSRTVCFIDGHYIDSLDTEEIGADAEVTKTFQWTAGAGSHNIKIVADFDNKLIENDKDNNTHKTIIHIIPPDLVIPNIGWSPESHSVGDTVTFTVTIKNQGSGKAENFRVAYYIDDTFLTSGYVDQIGSGASTNTTCNWKVQEGSHTFKAIADSNTMVLESDEDNNENAVIVVPNMPDLVIDNVTWSPAGYSAGDEVTFDIRIKNQGIKEAYSFRITYYVDGSIVGYKDISRIDAGATVTENFPWVATAGSHTIKIVADSNNQVAELDETNNLRMVTLPPPDLIIQDIAWSPTEASVGDTITFTASILNQGSGNTQNSEATCYIDGISIGHQDLPEIGSGNIVTKTFAWVAEPGTHIVRIAADPNNLITETDETNNEKWTDFSTMTPDLLIQDISWLMENPSINDVTFVVTIENQGSDKADLSQLTCYIDDSSVGDLDIKEINAGDIVTETFIIAVRAGPNTVRIVADANNQIAEIDETNNEKVLSFSSIAPDLVVKHIGRSPINAAVGDTVTITVEIENQGRDKAINPRLTLYIDDSPIDYCDLEEIEVGDIVTRDFTWIADAGSHDILALIDLDELVLESNETNNEKHLTLSLPAKVETTQQPVQPTPSSPKKEVFLGGQFWLLLVVAVILLVIAFVFALKPSDRR